MTNAALRYALKSLSYSLFSYFGDLKMRVSHKKKYRYDIGVLCHNLCQPVLFLIVVSILILTVSMVLQQLVCKGTHNLIAGVFLLSLGYCQYLIVQYPPLFV